MRRWLLRATQLLKWQHSVEPGHILVAIYHTPASKGVGRAQRIRDNGLREVGCFKIQKCKTHTRSCHRWNVSSQPGVFGGLSMAIVGAKHFYFAKNTYTSWQAHTQFAEFVWVRSPRQVHANFATTSSCLRVFPSFLAGCWYSSWFSYSPIQDLPCRFAFAVGQIIFHNTLHTVKLFLLLYPQLVAAHTREMNGVFQRA